MEMSPKNAQLIRKTLEHWQRKGLLEASQAARLADSVSIQHFDWRRLAKYASWMAIICVLIAIGSVFFDENLMSLLKRIFKAPPVIRGIVSLALAALLYRSAYLRKLRLPERVYSNESFFLLGVIATGVAVSQFYLALNLQTAHLARILLSVSVFYGVVAFVCRSNLIWLSALLALAGWFGFSIVYEPQYGVFYEHIEPYAHFDRPKFVVFGGLLALLALRVGPKAWFADFYKTSLITGLVLNLISLWSLSLETTNSRDGWACLQQLSAWHWSLLLGVVSAGSLLHGLKFDNAVTKGFGLSFLFINLYTRYCE